MAIIAQLYRDARWAARRKVEIEATLRDPDWSPADAVVEDLSASGFRVTIAAEFPEGAEVSLGIAGIGLRHARIVRRTENGYGCEFLIPLTEAQVRRAIESRPADPVALPAARAIEDTRYPLRTRLAIIAAGTLLSWGVLILLVWGGVRLLRALLAG